MLHFHSLVKFDIYLFKISLLLTTVVALQAIIRELQWNNNNSKKERKKHLYNCAKGFFKTKPDKNAIAF